MKRARFKQNQLKFLSTRAGDDDCRLLQLFVLEACVRQLFFFFAVVSCRCKQLDGMSCSRLFSCLLVSGGGAMIERRLTERSSGGLFFFFFFFFFSADLSDRAYRLRPTGACCARPTETCFFCLGPTKRRIEEEEL